MTWITDATGPGAVSWSAPLEATGGIVDVGKDSRDKIEFWREEVLRRTEQSLQGRLVGLWRTTDGKTMVPIAVGSNRELPPTAAAEITRALRAWHVPIDRESSWLAARLDMGRWCIAPVRADVPKPPPHGVERRKKERMMLELAGLCLGLIEERFAAEAARAAAAPAEAPPAQPEA